MILEFYPILYNHTTNPQKKQYVYKKYFRTKITYVYYLCFAYKIV